LSWKNDKEFMIINTRIYDFRAYIDSGFIHFGNKIFHTGNMDDYDTYKAKLIGSLDLTIIDGYGHIVLPGFIAGHTHMYSAFSRGMKVPFNPKSFQDILDQLWWKLDGKLDLDHVYYSGLTSAIDFAKAGVTTMIDHHASGVIEGSLVALESGVAKVGLRGGYCFETSDRFNVKLAIEENVNFMKAKAESKESFAMFGLHASMSLSDDTLIQVKRAIGSKPIHIHVAESKEDQDLCVAKYGKRIVQRLHDFELLNRGSILAHCIYINDEEAQLISESGCIVAMNVTSNMNNAVGLADIDLFRKYNIKCIIGNDGMTADIASEWRNTLFSMHHQTGSPIGFDLDDLHKMILNSYDVVNDLMTIRLGRLIADYESDIIMLPYQPHTPMNKDNALGHLFYGLFHNFRAKHVWCKGVNIIENYQLSPGKSNIQEDIQGLKIMNEGLWQAINEE